MFYVHLSMTILPLVKQYILGVDRMKKVGIITFSGSYNYGAILQSYALQTVIENLGYEVEYIDYRNEDAVLQDLSLAKKVRSLVWNRYFKPLIAGNRRKKKTNIFINKYLKVSLDKYTSKSQITHEPPHYDIYIAGSDQIWNPYITNFDTTYLLEFAPKDKKKLSYASSFGLPILPEKAKELYKERLLEMDSISVREPEGADIINKLIDKDVQVTLDPTFLLSKEHWLKISSDAGRKNDYILCYHMPGFPKIDKLMSLIADKISSETGKDIIHIGNKEYEKFNITKESIFDAGPAEYVGLFRSASYVLTNSFHGTCFSLIFGKDFYSIIDDTQPPGKSRNSRIESLLDNLDLKQRIAKVSEDKNFNESDILCDIKYDDVNPKLNALREKSIKFLNDSLES